MRYQNLLIMKNITLFLTIIVNYTIYSQIVVIPDANFKQQLINQGVDANSDGVIEITEAENKDSLNLTFGLAMLSMEGLEAFSNLRYLRCADVNIESIPFSNLTNLEYFYIDRPVDNNIIIDTLDFSQLQNLSYLRIHDSNLQNINLSGLQNLGVFYCITNHHLLSINVSNCPNLKTLYCPSNHHLKDININHSYNLETFHVPQNDLRAVNLSNTKVTNTIIADNNNLEYLCLKNGLTLSSTLFSNCHNLKYICVDESEIAFVTNKLSESGINGVVVGTDCTYDWETNPISIQGKNIWDRDNNGCDENDDLITNINFKVTQGVNKKSSFFTGNFENYLIPVEVDQITIEPLIENSDLFSITPSSVTLNVTTNNLLTQQDFCITIENPQNDLDIVIIPYSAARPGFEARYKVIYSNKGNTQISGKFELIYQDSLMSFLTSTPQVTFDKEDTLIINFDDLLPFETRHLIINMELNKPTDDIALNGGDTLVFKAIISPKIDDITPEDNIFTLRQEVVNSHDPNDKTCLQGEQLSPKNIGKYLHYLIRFENTGSASAVNILVRDYIDTSRFDINSFQTLEASHSAVTKITEGNKVEFIFKNIELPFEDDTNDGYILFKIKTLKNLQLGDTLANSAEIYFDYNPPIYTNNYEVTIVEKKTIGSNENTLGFKNLNLAQVTFYPNPVTDILKIKSKMNINSVNIYSEAGLLVKEVKILGSQNEIKLPVKSFLEGFYLILVKTEKGTYVEKILIK